MRYCPSPVLIARGHPLLPEPAERRVFCCAGPLNRTGDSPILAGRPTVQRTKGSLITGVKYPKLLTFDISQIQYVILGLLASGPKSVAKLRELLADDFEWQTKQMEFINPILRRWEDEGLLYTEEFDEGNRLVRLTAAGFRKWSEAFDFFAQLDRKWSSVRSSRRPEDFSDNIKPKERTPIIQRPPTAEESEAILKHARPDFAPIYRFSIASNVRVFDLANAQMENIDWTAGVLTLEPKSVSGRKIKNRRIALTDDLRQMLRRAVGTRTTGLIFPPKTGDQWREPRLTRMFREARTAAGLSDEIVMAGRGGSVAKKIEKGVNRVTFDRPLPIER